MPIVSEEYKEKKKRALLQAARRVFVRKGYSLATMQDIIEEAKVSRGSLYAYFTSIEHVYVELLRAEDQQDLQFFEQTKTNSSWEQLLQWIDEQRMKLSSREGTLVRANSEFFLAVQDTAGSASSSYILQRYERIIAVLTAFFEAGRSTGEFYPILPTGTIAHSFLSFMDGILLNSSQHGANTIKAQEQVEALIAAMKALLCPVTA